VILPAQIENKKVKDWSTSTPLIFPRPRGSASRRGPGPAGLRAQYLDAKIVPLLGPEGKGLKDPPWP
jgi:hypothetical protein